MPEQGLPAPRVGALARRRLASATHCGRAGQRAVEDRPGDPVGLCQRVLLPSIPPHEWPSICTRSRPSARRTVGQPPRRRAGPSTGRIVGWSELPQPSCRRRSRACPCGHRLERLQVVVRAPGPPCRQSSGSLPGSSRSHDPVPGVEASKRDGALSRWEGAVRHDGHVLRCWLSVSDRALSTPGVARWAGLRCGAGALDLADRCARQLRAKLDELGAGTR